jgi:hypothetical protein
VLLRLDDAGVHALLQAVRDLLLRHAARLRGVDAQHLQHRLGGGRQQLDERAGGARQPGHRPGHDASHRLRVELADALGHQLAEDDGDEGDDGDDDGRGGDAREALGHAVPLQPRRQRGAERRLADDAVQHADGRDADLHGREELGRVLQQAQRHRGALVAVFGHDQEAGLAAGGQCELGHREHAVEHVSSAISKKSMARGENPTRWDCI